MKRLSTKTIGILGTQNGILCRLSGETQISDDHLTGKYECMRIYSSIIRSVWTVRKVETNEQASYQNIFRLLRLAFWLDLNQKPHANSAEDVLSACAATTQWDAASTHRSTSNRNIS